MLIMWACQNLASGELFGIYLRHWLFFWCREAVWGSWFLGRETQTQVWGKNAVVGVELFCIIQAQEIMGFLASGLLGQSRTEKLFWRAGFEICRPRWGRRANGSGWVGRWVFKRWDYEPQYLWGKLKVIKQTSPGSLRTILCVEWHAELREGKKQKQNSAMCLSIWEQ